MHEEWSRIVSAFELVQADDIMAVAMCDFWRLAFRGIVFA